MYWIIRNFIIKMPNNFVCFQICKCEDLKYFVVVYTVINRICSDGTACMVHETISFIY